MAHVLMIGRSREYESRLEGLFSANLSTISGVSLNDDPDDIVEQLPSRTPDVIFLGPYLSFFGAIGLCNRLRSTYPETPLVLVHEGNPEIQRWITDLGAADEISPLANDDEVLGLLLRVLPKESSATVDENTETVETPAEPAETEPEPEKQPAKVIVVCAPKGGIGKTTTSVNLAVGLAMRSPEKVVLVDADIQFGDIANVLDIVPAHSLPDLVSGSAPTDTIALKALVTPHPLGFYVVCGSSTPEGGDAITGAQLSHLLAQLAGIFDFVVVDTTPGLGEHALAALDTATDLVLISSMGVPSLRALRTEIEVLDTIGLVSATRHVVLNFVDKHSGLTPRDASQIIGETVDVMIPRTKAVPLAMNLGVPLLVSQPKDAATRAIIGLINRLTGSQGNAWFRTSRKKSAA